MKKLLSTALLATLITSAAFATAAGPRHGGGCGQGQGQGPGQGLGGHGDMYTKLDRIVDLSDDQKTAIEELRGQMAPRDGTRGKPGMTMYKLDASAADYQEQVNVMADAAAERARERVLRHAQVHAKVQAILTDEQKAELKAFHDDRREFRNKWMSEDK